MVKERWENGKGALVTRGAFDGLGMLQQNKRCCPPLWACGAAGSALPWHGRGHRFDPDQVHQLFQQLSWTKPSRVNRWCPNPPFCCFLPGFRHSVRCFDTDNKVGERWAELELLKVNRIESLTIG